MTTPNLETPTIEETLDETQDDLVDEARATDGAPKKLISLRVTLEDLELAKALAPDFGIGYQTLLNQVIHEGLSSREEDLKYRQVVDAIKAALPELTAAEELANSAAVKAAQDLLASPAIKAAQELLALPAVKAAQELASQTTARVREIGSSQAEKAAQELGNTPVGKAIKEFTASPAFQAAQDLATHTSARLAREWANSPGARLARGLAGKDEASAPKQLQELTKAVQEMQDALRKANLLA